MDYRFVWSGLPEKVLAMVEREGADLGKAICNQSITVERLRTELEEERKASASAVEEALSMILRLQEEKASVMMEACQYQRLAEEKMRHADETLLILEEAMYNREVEIASLKYQIQAYKHKLLSTTFNSRDAEDMDMFDYPIFRSSSFLGKRSFLGFVRRNMSMPASQLDQLCSEIDIIDEGGYSPKEQSIWRKTDKGTAQLRQEYEGNRSHNFTGKRVTEKYFCGWERMKELWQNGKITDKVRSAISTNNEVQKFVVQEDHVGVGEYKSYSRYSEMNHDAYYDSAVVGIGTKLNGRGVSYLHSQTEDPENTVEYNSSENSFPKNEVNGKTDHSVSFQETKVPISHSCCVLSESYEHALQEPLPRANAVTGMPQSMPREIITKAVMHTNGGNILSSSREVASENYCLSDVDPDMVISTSRAEVKQLKKWMKQLNNDIRIVRQGHSDVGKLELSLLRDIRDQLNEMQSDIKHSNSKKCPPQDDSSLVLLTEAMLPFWL